MIEVFLTKGFMKKLAEVVNKNEKFKSAFTDFEASFIWNCPEKDINTYFEISKGQIVNVREAKIEETADYMLKGPWDVWIKIGKGELMIREAIDSDQLSFIGSIITLASYEGGLAVLSGEMGKLPKEF